MKADRGTYLGLSSQTTRNSQAFKAKNWVTDTVYTSVAARSLPPSYQSFPCSWGSLPSPRPMYHSCVWGNRHVTVTLRIKPGFILIWLLNFFLYTYLTFGLEIDEALGHFYCWSFWACTPGPGACQEIWVFYFYFNVTLFSCPSYTRFENWIFMTIYNFLEINIIEFLLIPF